MIYRSDDNSHNENATPLPQSLFQEIEHITPQLLDFDEIVEVQQQLDGIYIVAHLWSCEGRYRPWHWGFTLKIAATEDRALTLEDVVQTMHLTVPLTERALVRSGVTTADQAKAVLTQVKRAHQQFYSSLRGVLEILVCTKIVSKKKRSLRVSQPTLPQRVSTRLQQLLRQASFSYEPQTNIFRLSLGEVLWFLLCGPSTDSRQTVLSDFF